MIPDEEPQGPAPRDHNLTDGMLPLPLAIADLKEWLTEREHNGKTIAGRKDEFLRAAKNAVILDRASVGAAGDLIKLAARTWKRIDQERLSRSNLYRDVADALGRHAEEFWADVEEAMNGLHLQIGVWQDAEDARIEEQRREQEETLRAMRARTAAPVAETTADDAETPSDHAPEPVAHAPELAPVAKTKPVRGDYGAVVSRGKAVSYKVTDVRALPDYILNAPGVHEAIVAAVRSTRKVMGVPAGVEETAAPTTRVS